MSLKYEDLKPGSKYWITNINVRGRLKGKSLIKLISLQAYIHGAMIKVILNENPKRIEGTRGLICTYYKFEEL